MQLVGEYPVSVDNKGRLRLPTNLLRQLGDKPDDGKGVELNVNRGIEKCLTLYPKAVWEEIAVTLNALNKFNDENRLFIRRFYGGAYPLETDSADRILLQKPLLDYAGITDEAVLVAQFDRIEIWEPGAYAAFEEEASKSISALSNKVMGGGPGQADSRPF